MEKTSLSFKPCLCLFVLLFVLCPVYAQTVETVIEFSEDDLFFSRIDGYDVVEIDSVRSYLDGEEGKPFLPVVTANVLLPAGARILDVYSVVEEETQIEGKFTIMPTQKVVPISRSRRGGFVKPKQEVYNSPERQRVKAVNNATRKIMRGNYLAAIQVHPVDYIPAEQKLILRNKIRVYVDYELNRDNVRHYRRSKNKIFEQMIGESVLNPEALEITDKSLQTGPQTSEDEGDYIRMAGVPTSVVEYLIITKMEFVDEFMPLAEWKTKKGVPAEIVTVDWIEDNYPASTIQEQIKSCIQDYALNKGTIWVVLGADIDGVPDYDCYTRCNEYTITDMPTDLYYADTDVLDWNGDGDSVNGELEDGVDMAPDVFVGRISVNSEAQVTTYVNKTLDYEKYGPASNFAEKLLLSGAALWGYIGDVSDAEAKSELMWSSYIDPYWWGNRYRFYDTNTDFTGGSDYTLNPNHLNEQISAGYNFLHMSCHGSRSAWSIESGLYTVDDVASLSNIGKYINISTIACNTNQFDYIYGDHAPCLGETFIQKQDAGAISYFGCSRYGWGYSGTSAPGASLQYDQTFFNYLVRSTYGLHIGEVFARMKESKLPITSYGAMHWLQYGINLLGDPELPIYITDPQTLSPNYNTQINTGSQTFSVESYPGATICLFKDDEVYEYGQADGVGIFETQINPVNPGIMDVTITCNHYYPYEGQVTVGTVDGVAPSAPTGLAAIPATNQINLDWNDNSEPDLMQYNVYRSETGSGPYYLIAGGITSSDYQDLNVYGITYYYVVTAIDYSRNESADSSEASAAPIDTIAPEMPFHAYAGGAAGRVTVNCYKNTEPDLMHYEIWKLEPGEPEYTMIATMTNDSKPYYDYDVVINETYYYYLIAVDYQGNESPSTSPDSATVYETPPAPNNVTATGGNYRIILDWDDINDPNLWFYAIERSLNEETGFQTVMLLYEGSSFIDTGVNNGTTYYYTVCGVNDEGRSGPEVKVSAIPHPVIVPGAPAAPGDFRGSASTYYGEIRLFWDDNADLDTHYYNVYRSTTSGSGYVWIADTNDNNYYDSNVQVEVPYYYVVTCVDLEDLESAYSSEVEVTLPDSDPPAPPTGLITINGDGIVMLDWDNNAEPDLSHYNVYRKTSSLGAPWEQVNTGPVILSDFLDDTVSNGTTYYYSVTAVDIHDNESDYSSGLIPAHPHAGGVQQLSNEHYEIDFGQWFNSTEDTDDWTRNSGSTSSGGTGPDSGANGTTWYVYLETSSGYAYDPGDYAILESPIFNGTDRELSFYYHMYGADIGTLNVDVYDGSWHQGVWSISGQQHSSESEEYTQAVVDLSGYFGMMKIRFRAVAIGGYTGDIALDTITVTGNVPSDPTPPAVPTGLSAMGGDGIISLDWNDSQDADFMCFRVYRSTTPGSGYQVVASVVPDSTFIDEMVVYGTTYYYVVTAVDTSLSESTYSSEVSATPTGYGPPAPPTGLIATAGDSLVNLDWNDNSEPDLDGYNVYRSTTSGSGYVQINGSLVSSSDYTDNNVTKDTTYYYVVTAVNTLSNESGYSNEDSATPTDMTPPAPPTGFIATPGDGQVALDWDDNTEPDIDSYNVYRSTTSGSGYVRIAIVGMTYLTDLSVDNGITYYYVVTAVDTSDNESDYSTEVSATPQGGTPPAAPTGLVAAAGDSTVSLNWDDNSEPDLDGYNVYRSTTQGGGYSRINGSLVSSSNYTDNSVANGTTYYYVVTAVNTSSSESGYSNEDSATPSDSTAPAAPSGLIATGGDGTVSLNWNDNSEPDLDGYNVYRSTTSGGGYSRINGSLVSSSNYTDNSVANGTTYYYVVTAVDTSSNESSYSGEDSATPGDTTPPSAPTALIATGGDGSVSLNWNDNSEPDLDGYNVYRSTTQGSGYSQINGSLLSSSNYTDNSVTNGTTYYYVVTAVDTASNESGYSNEDSATPSDTTAPAAPTSLVATAGDSTVSLNWNDNSEPDLDGYNVYRSTTQGGGYNQINGSLLSSSNYTDNSVTNGTTYYYVVTAVDTASNESGYSNEDSATPQVVIPPSEVEILGSWTSGTSHTQESGTDRALILIAHVEEAGSIDLTSVTYGGQSMTKITDQIVGSSYRAYVVAYMLDEAGISAASGGTFSPSWSTTPDNVSYGSVFLSGVDQSDPIGATAGNGSASSSPNPITTSALSTEDGDMVILGATCGNTGNYTLNNGFTETVENDMSSSTGSQGYKSATGADETPSATHSSVNRQVIIGFVVQTGGIPDDPPAAPTGLAATAGDGSVSLDWDDNSEPDLDGYNVYRSTTSGSGYSKINGSLLSSSDYTDNSVTNGTTYYYVVTAVDLGSNESGDSAEDSATPTDTVAPAAPTGLIASAGDGSVSLDWNDNGEGDLDGYNVYRSTTSGGGYSRINGSLISSSNYTDNSVTNGTTYYYVVTAVDTSSNESGYSGEDSATPTDTTAPAAPTGLIATAGDGSISLNWNDNGEPDLDGYNVYRSTTQGSGYIQINGPLLSSSDYTDNSVTNGTTYYYVVTAVDTVSNESGYSNEDSATPGDTTPPSAPTSLIATGGDGTVSLNWNDNGEPDLDGYNVYRSTTQGSGYSQINGSLLSSSDYTDNSVTNGTTYYYVVTAVDTASNESGYSNEDSATPSDVTAPAAPTGLIANGGDGSVSLNWNDNGEPDLDGYNVYRSTTSGSDYSQINGSLLSSSDYTDNSVTNGTTYYYVVTAVDTSSNESGYSGENSATPSDITPPSAPTSLVATGGDGTVSLNWNDNGEPDLDGYNVYRSATSGSGYSQINGSLLSSSDYTDNSVTNGTTYYYVVTAVDTASNESGYSNEDSATPDVVIPSEVEIIGSWVTGTSHTQESGNNRVLIVIAHAEGRFWGTPSLSTVTYGGQTMTKITDKVQSGWWRTPAYVGAFILDEAGINAATSNTISASWGGSPTSTSLTSVFLQNVDQAGLVGDYATNGVTNNGTVSTSALTTSDGDMVIEGGTCTETGTYTANTGFTESVELSVSGFDGMDGYKSATGSNETPSVTHSSGTNRQALLGFVVQN